MKKLDTFEVSQNIRDDQERLQAIMLKKLTHKENRTNNKIKRSEATLSAAAMAAE